MFTFFKIIYLLLYHFTHYIISNLFILFTFYIYNIFYKKKLLQKNVKINKKI